VFNNESDYLMQCHQKFVGNELNRSGDMSDKNKSTRLGDILIDKGLITRQQLREAIEIQQARRFLAAKEGVEDSQLTAIGEILIELGFIDRQQLARTLSWQSRLRKATLVMTFVTPLLTAACGGAPATNTSGGNNKTEVSSSVSSVMVQQSSSQASLVASSHMSVVSSTPSSTAASSQPAVVSSSSSSISSASISSSSASSEAPSVAINGPVYMKWSIPSKRENGEDLNVEEIGGYELRYKSANDAEYVSITISGGEVDSYYFNHLEGDLAFEIAAYDINGLYSRFVAIQPQLN